jgi:subtilisin family serine protease
MVNTVQRILTWLVIVVLAAGTVQTRSFSSPMQYASGVLLVGLAQKGNSLAVAGLEKALQARQVGALPQVNALVLQVPPGQERQAVLLARQQPGVAFAELDYAVSVDGAAAQTIPTARVDNPSHSNIARSLANEPSRIPNDPYFHQQWSFSQIGAPMIWHYTTGSPDILIAIVDSGIQLDHPDLVDKIWTNPGEIPGNHLDDDGNGKVDDLHGWHFYHLYTGSGFVPAEDANVSDDFGHGTHVAGIAAAATDNSVGIAGLAWGTRILPVKVLDEYGSGWYSDIAAGIIYAADNGAKIINLSLGGESDSLLLHSAVDYARNRGALVVAAAGNNSGPVYFPAAYDPVLAVAATDENDQRPAFSNYGPQVDLAAPGTNIYSTWYRSNYFSKSGTSMATPHVSGVAALLWSRNPNLTADEITDILIHSTVDIEPAGKDDYTGWGRLSANRAIGLMEGLPDLWVKSSAPDYVRANQVVTFTVTCGNSGFGDVQDGWITSTFSTPGGSSQGSSWMVSSLPVASDPITFTLTITAGAPGSVLTHTIEISSLMTETNPIDNVAQIQVNVQSEVYLPFVSRP